MTKVVLTRSKNYFPSVSVVVPMRNAATTVIDALTSLVKQTYPIVEIIVVDNVSKDNSCELVSEFAKKSKIHIRLVKQKVDRGVSSSYNKGTTMAKSKLVVFMTSDCVIPTNKELELLTRPVREKPSVAASYSTCLLPRYVWDTYNFWEKYFSARMVDSKSSLMVLKFDCVRRDAFLKIGGFDEKNFGGDSAIGGEDADLSTRLRTEGEIVRSNATSIHLHYKGDDYTLSHMIKSRKMYARSYGRFLKKSAFLQPKSALIFLIRPFIAVLPFFPYLHQESIFVLIVYSFLYSRKMFTTISTLSNPRIIFIPLLNVFFLYYELFWMIRSFVSRKK